MPERITPDRTPDIQAELDQDLLRRTNILGFVDQKTGLPGWAVGDSEAVRLAGEAAIRLYAEMLNLQAAVDLANGNGELTQSGKDARIRQAATMFVKVDVAIARGRRDALAREAQRARGALSVPKPEGDKVVIALRASELRRRFDGLEQMQVDLAALEAGQRGDVETLSALFDAPGPALVSEEGRQHATTAFFAGSRADEMARAERLESALRQLNGQIAAAQSRAQQLGAEDVGPMPSPAVTGPISNTAALPA